MDTVTPARFEHLITVIADVSRGKTTVGQQPDWVLVHLASEHGFKTEDGEGQQSHCVAWCQREASAELERCYRTQRSVDHPAITSTGGYAA